MSIVRTEDYQLTGAPHVYKQSDLPLQIRTAVAIGNFDGVHIGHQALLRVLAEQGKAHGAAPMVFTFTENPKVLHFGAKYICDEDDRLESLAEAGVRAAYSAEFGSLCDCTCEEFVRDFLVAKLGCVCAVVGSDFRFGKGRMGDPSVMCELMRACGGDCVVLPALEQDGAKISSSNIRKLLGSGKLDEVENLLGRKYSFILPVIGGRKLGHRIGYPTINQLPHPDRMLPRFGVYESIAEFVADGKPVKVRGVTNAGVKPTVSSDSVQIFETHLLDFDGDLYGKKVKVTLLRFLRKERCFSSVEELQAQIARDIAAVRKGEQA